MSTLTIRLPDDKHERLKALARSNSISINKLMDELATVALANFDARVRFETRPCRRTSCALVRRQQAKARNIAKLKSAASPSHRRGSRPAFTTSRSRSCGANERPRSARPRTGSGITIPLRRMKSLPLPLHPAPECHVLPDLKGFKTRTLK